MSEEKKKKRTILMSEDPSEVTPQSLASRATSFVDTIRPLIRPRDGGVGGTLAKGDKSSLKWKAGIIKSDAKSAKGKRKGKSKRGIQIEFKF